MAKSIESMLRSIHHCFAFLSLWWVMNAAVVPMIGKKIPQCSFVSMSMLWSHTLLPALMSVFVAG